MTPPRLLIAHLTRAGETEAEPVVVDYDHGELVAHLDDGSTLVIDACELLATIGGLPARKVAA